MDEYGCFLYCYHVSSDGILTSITLQTGSKGFYTHGCFSLAHALIVMAAMVIFWWAGVLPYEFGIDITRIPGAGG